MGKIIHYLWFGISSARLILHFIAWKFSKNREFIDSDIERWRNARMLPCRKYGLNLSFLYLMTFFKEYRNLFYKRIGFLGKFLKILCKEKDTLEIRSGKIGKGFLIYHGLASCIYCKQIGDNCTVYQQITIGSYGGGENMPIIGDNCIIYAGAKVFGKIKIGNNVIVGANAVVCRDVPDNCTVVGVPAYIVKKNGVKIREILGEV